jgi:alpha-L-rhamnosidase
MNHKRLFSFLLLSLLFVTTFAAKKKPTEFVSVNTLRTEQMVNPMGIGTAEPRFSWVITSNMKDVMQTSFHLLAASSMENLNNNIGDLWNSAQQSSSSIWVPYVGKKLKSNMRVYWKVKVVTNKGEAAWSEAAYFSVGLLTETRWKGMWIGADRIFPWDSETRFSRLSARYFRKEFTINKQIKQVKQATLYIAGMGLYELYVNGQKVGNQVMAPAPTDYRKTVIYNTFDVTSLLSSKNTIGVTLGNGRFYTMRQAQKPYKITNFGYPKLRLNLIIEYTDGSSQTVITDESWKYTADGPIRSNNEYDGETYDACKELGNWASVGYDDNKWLPVERVAGPTGTLRGIMSPNMKVNALVTPKTITKLGNKYILDMGQNFAGWLRMKVKGNNGDTIRLRFSETLQKSGELYVANFRSAKATDVYVCNGKETENTTWAPRFVTHGFRYVEISGYKNPLLTDFKGEVVDDEMRMLGSFSCSNDILNKIYDNTVWGIRSNYKGMPTDCPQRDERQPWLGDRSMGSWGESFVMENGPLYSRWMNDIREAQREDGCIPDVAPAYWNYYTDNVTWPSVLLSASDMLYTHYGNLRPIQKNYPSMKLWMNHLSDEYTNENGLVTCDKYGDWCVPPEALDLIHSKDPARQTDGKLMASAYYIKMLQTMHRFASLLGYKEDMAVWESREHQMKDAFNKVFLTVKEHTSQAPGHVLYPDSIFYGNNTVTANILPLAFGIVPKAYINEVVKNVVNSIMTINRGHISCGVIGVQWLMRELSRRGFSNIAYLLATNTSYPSWGYMVKEGATTIWELWNGNTANPAMNSGNHVMLLGDLIPWIYENLGGIKTSRSDIAFKKIIMKPNFDIQDLDKVDASYMTPYGKVVSQWNKTQTILNWHIEIPVNTTAEVYLPDSTIQKIGSGSYDFKVNIKPRDSRMETDEFVYTSASFPECHAATIAETTKGDLVTAFFGGTKEANPDCCIWLSRKSKKSDVWSAPVKVADGVLSSTLRKACWNPVLFQIPGSDLLLFYKVGIRVADWTAYVIRSKDGGVHWSKPQQLPQGFLGPAKNKPIWLDGKIICPSGIESNGCKVHFEVSEDKGKTWRKVGPLDAELSVPTQFRKAGGDNVTDKEAGEAIANKGAQPIFALQPTIIKLADGRLQIFCRSRNAKLATAYSSDKGESWSKVSLSDLPSNNSGIDAVTLADGRHLIAYNDFSTLAGTPKGVRTPLCLAISDDGKVWKHLMTLEDSPISQYSYPSIIQSKDGKVHIVYTWRRQRIKYVRIKL